jgi:hypothetical protein
MGRMPDLSNMQRIGLTGWVVRFGNLLISISAQWGNSVTAVQDELARPQVMAVVDDLVAREASGVLEVAGNPAGVIYLDGGRIAYARASWVPGLAVRLRAIVPSLTGTGEPRLGEDAADAAVAALAVRHGYLTTDELHELIGSVIVEAFLVLTIPLAADSPVGAVRFTSTPVYWSDLFPRLGIDVVREEAVSRAELMAACGLAPTTAVAPRDLAAPSAVLTPEQWAVACQLGDRVSARELAMRRGASLADMVHCLGSLVRAGLCVPVQPARRGRYPYGAAPSATPLAAQPEIPPRVTQPSASLPAAQPEVPPAAASPVTPMTTPMTESLQVRPAWDPAWRTVRPARPPSVEVLRQVLDGLRRL